MNNIRRGDIFYADLSPVVGSEQGGLRPVLIVQNDVGNRYSPTVIAAAITSRMGKNRLPTHIDIRSSTKPSVAAIERCIAIKLFALFAPTFFATSTIATLAQATTSAIHTLR